MKCPGSEVWRLAGWIPVLTALACALGTNISPEERPSIAALAPTLTATQWQPSPSPTEPRLAKRTSTPRPTPLPSATNTPMATPTKVSCNEPGQVVTSSHSSLISGQMRNYRVYLPPCYGQDGRVYPTLYLFHGGVHDDSHWDRLGIDEAAESAIQAGSIPSLVIVMPDGGQLANNSSGGPFSFEGVVLRELIPHIEASYCVWRAAEGRAIGGLSRGGYWALEIAFRNAASFASVGGHSAALLDVAAGPNLNPQYTGLHNNLGGLRIYLDIGRDDWVIGNIQRLHEEMERASLPHVWVLNDGEHGDPYWQEHLGAYLTWYGEPWPLERNNYPRCDSNT